MPTTSVRRRIFLFSRSCGLLDQICFQFANGNTLNAKISSPASESDGASNRYWVKVGTQAAVTTVFDSSSHPVSSSDGTSYTVDAVGNLTKIDRAGTGSDWVFSYDPYSRQTCARQASTTCSGTGTISYLIDPFGRALTRTKGSSSTTYAYRGISETLAKTVAGSTTMTYAATPSGTPLAQQKNGQASSTRYFLQDPHGDLVGLVTKDPTFKGTVSYDPWGTKLSTSGNESSVLGFQSDLTDPDSALVDMGTRWYVPSLGRFSTRDVVFGEVQNPASLNMFAYGLSAPVTYVDPTGMGSISGQEGSQQDTESYGDYTVCKMNAGTNCSAGWQVAPPPGGPLLYPGTLYWDVSYGDVYVHEEGSDWDDLSLRSGVDLVDSCTGGTLFSGGSSSLGSDRYSASDPWPRQLNLSAVIDRPCGYGTSYTPTTTAAGSCTSFSLAATFEGMTTALPSEGPCLTNPFAKEKPLPEVPGDPPPIDTGGGPLDPNTGSPYFLKVPFGCGTWCRVAIGVLAAGLAARILKNICQPSTGVDWCVGGSTPASPAPSGGSTWKPYP